MVKHALRAQMTRLNFGTDISTTYLP